MRKHGLWAAVGVWLTGPAPAAATPVERWLGLREVSILKLPALDEPWKVNVLRADGKIAETTFRLSELNHLSLTPERLFEKKRAILSAVQQLGSDDFAEREGAHR